MAQRCQSCSFYSPDPLPEPACPECGSRLVFSLLPPAGQSPAPLPDIPESRSARLGENPWQTRIKSSDSFDWKLPNGSLVPLVLLGLLIFAGYAFWSWNQRAVRLNERVSQLAVGMTVSQAFSVMGDVPPDGLGGTGEIIWEGGDQAVKVRFVHGIVQDIHRQEARGGLHVRHVGR